MARYIHICVLQPADSIIQASRAMSGEKPLDQLPPAAKRALKEAEQRRQAEDKPDPKPEHGGRKGPEPTRFGDWEKNGIISDF